MFLLDDLLLSPISGFKFILRTLQRTAEEEWTDEAPLKEELLLLNERLEAGEISEQQYVQREAEILRELRQVRERKEQLAGKPPEAISD